LERDTIGNQSPGDQPSPLPDQALVAQARDGDLVAFELLMRRHNQRVYRVVRSVLRNPAEIEDAIQQAYLSAFAHLDQFKGTAGWSTWLCRIAFNEALARLRSHGRFVSIDEVSEGVMSETWKTTASDPERAAANHELAQVVEQAIDGLPDIYRSVLIMREIEGMTTAEVADVLEVADEVVKTRLHRARTALRSVVEQRIGQQLKDAYAFGNERCDRVVAGVLARLCAQ
jgi:RNA polymerase sigma-70 factor (ECF subfamily)